MKRKKKQDINKSGVWHIGTIEIETETYSKDNINPPFAIFNIESPLYYTKLVKEIKRRVDLIEVVKENNIINGAFEYQGKSYPTDIHTYEDKNQNIVFDIEEKIGKFQFTFDFNNYKLSGVTVGDKSAVINILNSNPETISLILTTNLFNVIHSFEITNIKFQSNQNKANLH